jgi:hypothetical protein
LLSQPGHGWCVVQRDGVRLGVVNRFIVPMPSQIATWCGLNPAGDGGRSERRRTQHGFVGSPVLVDLDSNDGGRLEIVAAAMDRHVYAWNDASRPGRPLGGALALGGALLAACGGSSASPAQSITLYTCVNDTTIQPVLTQYQATHPGAKVELFRAPTGQLNARVASDIRTGGLKADVIWGCDPLTVQDYVAQGLVGGWTPETEIPATVRTPDYVGIAMLYLVAITRKGVKAPASWTASAGSRSCARPACLLERWHDATRLGACLSDVRRVLVGDQDVHHAERERAVGAGLRGQPLVGELDVVGVVRGDRHHLLAAVARRAVVDLLAFQPHRRPAGSQPDPMFDDAGVP